MPGPPNTGSPLTHPPHKADSEVLTKPGALAMEHQRLLLAVYGLCWFSTFFLKSFNSTERFLAVPLALLLLPVLAVNGMRGKVSFLVRSPILWAVAALCIAVVLSVLLSPIEDQRSYRHLILTWGIFFLAGYALRLAMPRTTLRLLLAGVISGVLSSGAVAGIGVLLTLIPAESLFLGPRLTLFFIHPNYLGLYCGLGAASLFYALRCGRPVFCRSIDAMCFCVLLFMLWETESRASLTACAAALAWTLIVTSGRPVRSACITALIMLCSLSGLALIGKQAPFGNHPVYQKITQALEDPMKDPGIAGRLMIWQIALGNAAQRPLTGWGFRTYPVLHDRYLEENTPELMEQFGFVEPNVRHAHNLFVGALAELGIMGTIPLALCFLWVAVARNSGPGSDIQLIKVLTLYLFLQELMEYILERVFFSNIFFAFLGILLACKFLDTLQTKRIK